jgi:NDP-sugar pyrophosphorylase family protein
MAQSEAPHLHGIVLAGVYPRGQKTLDQLAPRPLLPVAQQPLITYALRWMGDGGLRDATICANTAARDIRTRLGGTLDDLRLHYHEDWSPRGAAGCVRDAALKTDARTLVVADATTVPVVDLLELLAAHQDSGAVMTVVVGADAAGRLRPSGAYVFDRRALAAIPEEGFQDIKEKLIPRLYKAGEQVATFMAPSLAPRVVNAETYLALNHWALERTKRYASLDYRTVGEALVHGSATVAPTARLLGPVLLGPRVKIDEGATLIGPVSIGEDTTIGPEAVVSRSVVWAGCEVGAGAFVDRSLLADHAVVGPHKTVYSAVKVGRGSADSRPEGKAVWAPLVAALQPPAIHQP